MDYDKLIKKAENLRGLSRFEVAQIKERAEQRRGPLAGLSRFEIAQVTMLYEKDRE